MSQRGIAEISDEGQALLVDTGFPAVETTGGTVKGVEEVERQRRLEALGYW